MKNIVEVSTFKVNAKRTKLEEFAASEKETEAEAAGGGDDDWMDPRMGKAGKQRGRRGGFQVRCVRRAPFVRRPPVLSAPRRAVRSRIPPRTIRFFNLERAHCILSKPRGRPRRRGDYRMRQRSFSRFKTRVGGSPLDRVTRRWDIDRPSRPELEPERASYTLSRELLLSRCNFYACENDPRPDSWRRVTRDRNPLPSGRHLRAILFSRSSCARFCVVFRRRMKLGMGNLQLTSVKTTSFCQRRRRTPTRKRSPNAPRSVSSVGRHPRSPRRTRNEP